MEPTQSTTMTCDRPSRPAEAATPVGRPDEASSPAQGGGASAPAAQGGPAGSPATAAVKCCVVVPTYNEAENILDLLEHILALPLDIEILVVDDASPDGTAAVVAERAQREPRLHLMRRAGKLGLGSAYVEGFRWVLANTRADLIFQMDADFSHDPQAIPAFVSAAEQDDLVLGSRYLRGVTVVNWPLSRLILSYGANLYTRLVTGLRLMDATGGYKCFRREVLETLDLGRIRADGYSFQIETTYLAWRRGFRIREIPIMFVDRRVGISKMNRRIIAEAVFMVWRLALTHLFQRKPAQRETRPLQVRNREKA
jgi:dolichol-phosphate mannosyltransferase